MAIAAHVAEVRPDDSVGFHHPAFREVVYAELLPGERARLHRAAAEALTRESAPAPEVAGELARHWHLAGDLERALAASIEAGRAHQRMYAFADAYSSYRLALELLDQVPADIDRVDLAARAAAAGSVAGESAAAVRLLEAELARDRRSRSAGPSSSTGSARCSSWPATRRPPGRRTAAPWTCSPTTTRAGSPPGCTPGTRCSRPPGPSSTSAEAAASHALAVSRALGTRRPEGTALNALGLVAATRGDLDRGVELLRESLAIAREVQSPHDVGLAYVNLSHVLGLAARLDDGVALCREGVPELGRYGQDRQFGSLLLCNTSDTLIKAGRLAEAEELIDDALSRHPRGVMAAPVLLLAARLTVAQGDLTVAWERCEQARLVIEAEGAPLGWLREITETAAEVELWAGRPEPARELVTDGLAAIAGTGEAVYGSALVALGLRALADEAVSQRDHKSRTRRAGAREQLLGTLADIRSVPGHGGLPDDAALDLLCTAEQARLDHVAPRSDPLGGSRRGLGRRSGDRCPRRTRAGARRSPCWRTRSTPSRSGCCGRCTRRRSCWAPYAWWRRSRPWRGGTGSTCCPLPEEHVDRDTEALEAYALTAREREVLAALAAGHTNKEIADSAVHQREDRLGARLQHPAQARRAEAARRPPGSPTGWA